MTSHGLAEAAESGLVDSLHKLAVRSVVDLMYLRPEDLDDEEKFRLPLVDKRKFICLLQSLSGKTIDPVSSLRSEKSAPIGEPKRWEGKFTLP